MWYWVKTPTGVEADYSLAELKTALRQGIVQFDWVARRYTENRWMTVNELVAIEMVDLDEDASAASRGEQERPNPEQEGRNQEETDKRICGETDSLTKPDLTRQTGSVLVSL